MKRFKIVRKEKIKDLEKNDFRWKNIFFNEVENNKIAMEYIIGLNNKLTEKIKELEKELCVYKNEHSELQIKEFEFKKDAMLDLEYLNEMLTLELKELKENRLHNLDIYDKVSTDEMFEKLKEEVEEVKFELIADASKDSLASELLDVMQCCVGIARTKGIDLFKHIKKHNKKLKKRGHKFL